MPLASFETMFPGRSLQEHAALHPSSVADQTPPAPGSTRKPVVYARVNAGRWIADCPDPDCNGAEYANLDGKSVLFCCECRNARAQNRPIMVELPDKKTIAAIDDALSARPVPATRNWEPGETVDGLLAENIEHGLEAP